MLQDRLDAGREAWGDGVDLDHLELWPQRADDDARRRSKVCARGRSAFAVWLDGCELRARRLEPHDAD